MVILIKKSQKKMVKNTKFTAWKDELWVKIYELAKSGLRNEAIAKAIGVRELTLRRWIKNRPALKKCLEEARKTQTEISEAPFREYIFQKLSPEMKKLWEEINELDSHDSGVAILDAIFKKRGVRARQHLFLHSLICSNFNLSKACRKVGISLSRLNRWRRDDPDFAELIAEMNFHKGNFFEEALVKLVKSGDPSAVIFVNKTYNKDRGYSEKVNVEVTEKNQGMIDISELDVPIEVRRTLLKALREKTEGKKTGEVLPSIEYKNPNNVDIEVEAKVVSPKEGEE